jgi:hypothetical protein
MTTSGLIGFTSAAYACAFEMMQNAAYIREHLPDVDLSAPLRESVLDVCSSLIGTKHDVLTELHDLHELGAAWDSAVVQDRVARIEKWLAADLPALHAVVMALEPTGSLAYLLVAESATNILNRFNAVCAAAGGYRDAIRDVGQASVDATRIDVRGRWLT